MYERVVNQLLSTESCQFVVSKFCDRDSTFDWNRGHTGETSICQKVGESHCDRYLCTGLAACARRIDVVV
jgi:hypothetical protein